MSKIPEPIWISLQETLDLVADKTKEPQEVVKQRLVEAFIDEVIETTGDCQSLQAGPHITGSVWRSADVSWADNALNPRLYETEKAVETPKITSLFDRLPGGVTYAEYEYDERLGEMVVRPIGSNQFDQVQVRREDVVRWLGDDGPPVGEDETPATIEGGTGTGGKHKRKGSDDAKLKNRIESVIARARTRWPDRKNRPSPHTMSKALCPRGQKFEGYSDETVEKILDNKYPAMARLKVNPLK